MAASAGGRSGTRAHPVGAFERGLCRRARRLEPVGPVLPDAHLVQPPAAASGHRRADRRGLEHGAEGLAQGGAGAVEAALQRVDGDAQGGRGLGPDLGAIVVESGQGRVIAGLARGAANDTTGAALQSLVRRYEDAAA